MLYVCYTVHRQGNTSATFIKTLCKKRSCIKKDKQIQCTIVMRNNRKTRIIIAGAGFAGIHAYSTLHKRTHAQRDFEITLINQTDYLRSHRWYMK